MTTPDPAARGPLSGGPLDVEGGEAPDHRLQIPESDRYQRGGLLGRGGMGEVRAAFDLRLERDVAVKSPRRPGGGAERQLVQEAALAAELEHPGILAVYDAGRLADGRPYYTMPIVRGRSLAQLAADQPAPRLRLIRPFLDACEAVAYAHSRGVVHRDLKPGNVMVGDYGETFVVDWGLAARVGEPGAVGTPRYASPEQARGAPATPAADVYGLGAILCELLTGAPPPRDGPLPTNESAPPELAAIVEKSTRADAAARYPDAGALAADVASWFEGRQVSAYEYTVWELLSRLVAAWRIPLTIGALALIAVAAAIAAGWWRTSAERNRAIAAERDAVAAQEMSERHLARALVAQAREAEARDERADAEVLAAAALELEDSPEARGVLARFWARPRPRLLGQRPLPTCDRLAASPEGARVACMRSDEVLLIEPGAEARIRLPLSAAGAMFLGGPDRLALTTVSGGLYLWEAERGLSDPLRDLRGWATLAGESEHGELLLTAGGYLHRIGADGSASPRLQACGAGQLLRSAALPGGSFASTCNDGGLWIDGRTRQELEIEGIPVALSVAEDGRVAVGTTAGEIRVLDLESGDLARFESADGPVQDLQFAGDRLSAAWLQGGVTVWSLGEEAPIARLPSAPAVARWRDGGVSLRVIGDGVEDWAIPEAQRPHLYDYGSGVAGVAVSHDGASLGAACGDGAFRLARLADGGGAQALQWQPGVAKDLSFSPDGSALAAGVALSRELRILDATTGETRHRIAVGGQSRVVWLRGDLIAIAPYRQGVSLWRLPEDADGAPIELTADGDAIGERLIDLEPDPDAAAATLLDLDGGVWRLTQGPTIQSFAEHPSAVAVAGADDRVAVALSRGVILYENGREVRRMEDTASRVVDAALSPDGAWLALGHLDGMATVWSTVDLSLAAILRGHEERVASVTFDPESRWLITGSWDGAARVWSTVPLDAPAADMAEPIRAAWGRGLEDLLGDAGPAGRSGF